MVLFIYMHKALKIIIDIVVSMVYTVSITFHVNTGHI